MGYSSERECCADEQRRCRSNDGHLSDSLPRLDITHPVPRCGNEPPFPRGVFQPRKRSSIRNTGHAVMVKANAPDTPDIASRVPTATIRRALWIACAVVAICQGFRVLAGDPAQKYATCPMTVL